MYFELLTTVAGSDYQVPPLPRIDITLSGANMQTECINVTINDDDALECEEDFMIEIVSVTGVTRIIEPNTTVVTILDNEGTLHLMECLFSENL